MPGSVLSALYALTNLIFITIFCSRYHISPHFPVEEIGELNILPVSVLFCYKTKESKTSVVYSNEYLFSHNPQVGELTEVALFHVSYLGPRMESQWLLGKVPSMERSDDIRGMSKNI